MSLLRIRCSLRDAPPKCRWVLLDGSRGPLAGESLPAQLPQRPDRVQLVLPAGEVLITRARLPQSARRKSGSLLAFAVEEQTLGEPDAQQVTWLGSAAGTDVLAVVDQPGLKRWQDALAAAGIAGHEVHCETLLLPWTADEWSLAWDGREGFVRTGAFEGTTTDCGDAATPPLSLRMMLDEAKTRGEAPTSIAVYPTAPEALPEIEPWQRALGVAIRSAGSSDWKTAPAEAGVSLSQERARWRLPRGTLARLKPAAWIAGAALAVHAAALAVDWARLASEQLGLRRQMEARFRTAFPDAVAVADPALQMRRNLAEARHAAGVPDDGDFLPMMVKVAGALKGAPASGLRVLSYESGRMTLELTGVAETNVRRIVARLLDAGMRAESSSAPNRSGGAAVVLTVRPS